MKFVWAILFTIPLNTFAQGSKALILRAHVPYKTSILITSSGEAIVKSNSKRFALKPQITSMEINNIKLVTVVHP